MHIITCVRITNTTVLYSRAGRVFNRSSATTVFTNIHLWDSELIAHARINALQECPDGKKQLSDPSKHME